MTLLVPVLFVAMAAGPAQQPAQPPAPSGVPAEAARPADEAGSQSAGNGDEPAGELPVSLSRIQRELSRPPAIRLEGNRLVFRVEVLGRKPTIEDILGPDYLKGPVPYRSEERRVGKQDTHRLAHETLATKI